MVVEDGVVKALNLEDAPPNITSKKSSAARLVQDGLRRWMGNRRVSETFRLPQVGGGRRPIPQKQISTPSGPWPAARQRVEMGAPPSLPDRKGSLMDTPVEIHFHGIEKSEAIEERVRWKVSKLEKHFGRMTRCRVVLEAPHRSPTKPKVYQIEDGGQPAAAPAHRGEPRARGQPRQRGAAVGLARCFRGGAAQGRRDVGQDRRAQQARARPPPAASADRARSPIDIT